MNVKEGQSPNEQMVVLNIVNEKSRNYWSQQ